MWSKIKPYVISIAIALSVGALAALLTRNSMNVYSDIRLPPLAPPSILFPIVWTILYILMGVSAAMIATDRIADAEQKERALATYAASLVFNFAWSIIFFRFRSFFVALLCLLVLLFLIIKTIIEYRKINPIAAYLQIPYALWVTFAGYLNAAIWLLNR